MSIDAMRMGVVEEVSVVAAYDQSFVAVHWTFRHWVAVQAELRSRQRQCLQYRLLVDAPG